MVIPQSDKVKTLTKKPYKELEGWSEKMGQLYAGYEGMKIMTDVEKGREMGTVSNLITDMTIQGAPDEKIIRAVKHSMVVIDAQKHGYNWRLSEQDLGINALRKEYQSNSKSGKGAATLISKASGQQDVLKRALGYRIDPETGEKVYRETGETYFKPVIDKKTGEVKEYKEIARLTKSTKMDEVFNRVSPTGKLEDAVNTGSGDARTLSSGTIVEEAYAEYANKLRALANKARKESIDIQIVKVDPALKKEYADEIASLNAKVNVAEANAPKERIAQVRANAWIREKTAQMPELKSKEYAKDLKKLRQISIADARSDVGASKKEVYVHLTDREKQAIEAGAVSSTLLSSIMKNMDKDELREYVQPKEYKTVPSTKIDRMKAMDNIGYTLKEIAEATGLPVTTVSYYVNGGDEK